MAYAVYVLKSEKSGLKYIGHTENLEKRLKEHNTGRNISTKAKGPWRAIHSEVLATLELAKKREQFFKTGRGRVVLKNIVGA